MAKRHAIHQAIIIPHDMEPQLDMEKVSSTHIVKREIMCALLFGVWQTRGRF